MRWFAPAALMVFSIAGCGGNNGDASISDTQTSLQRITGDWQIARLNGRETDSEITLLLRSNSTFSGSAPCNRYSGNYNVSGKVAFTVSPIRSTRRACPDLATESEYFALLESVVEYRLAIDSTDLRLLNRSGKAVLVFSPAQ